MTMVLRLEKTSTPTEEINTDIDIESAHSMLGMVSTFSHQTSLHGVKFILRSGASKPRRIFWCAVIGVQVSLFVVVLAQQLGHMSQYPVLTKVITKYVDSLPFPAVTICSETLKLENNSMTPFEREVVLNIWSSNTSYFRNMPEETYKAIHLADIWQKWFLSTEELVQWCSFAKRDCMKNIKRTWAKQSMCYTVNSVLPEEESPINGNFSPSIGDPTLPLVSTAPGAEMGLALQLNVANSVTGAKVLLHQPDEKITQSNSEFLVLAPGSSNFIGVKVRENKFLPPPFNAFGSRQCQKTSGNYRHPLVEKGRYTLRACQDACFFKQFEVLCGCKAEIDWDNVCDPLTVIDCIYPGFTVGNTSKTPYACNCPFPCEDIVYDTTLSSLPDSLHSAENRTDYIRVNIHFDRLRIELTEQVPDYTREDVFASVGGQMGLFLGASLITLIEVVELLARCVCRRLLRNPNRATPINVN